MNIKVPLIFSYLLFSCSHPVPTKKSAPVKPVSPIVDSGHLVKPVALEGLTPQAMERFVARVPMVNVPVAHIIKALPLLGRPRWTALYISGSKMGYGMERWIREPYNGKTYVVREEMFHMELRRGRDRKVSHTKVRQRFEGWGNGRMVTYSKIEKSEREVREYELSLISPGRYRQRSRSLLLSRMGEGAWSVSELAIKPETLSGSSLAVTLLIARRPVKGARTWKMLKFSPDKGRVGAEVISIYGPATQRGAGAAGLSYRGSLISVNPHMTMGVVIGAKGELLSGRAGIMELREVTRAEALRLGTTHDIETQTYFPTTITTITPTTKKLTLSLKGPFPRGVRFFNKNRYAITFGKEGAFSLTLTLDDVSTLTEAVPPSSLAPYLKATTNMEVNDPLIRRLVLKGVLGAKTRVARARNLVAFVYKYITKSLDNDLSSAVSVAKARIGDCTEHALLYTTLARAAGIPARTVGGVGIVKTARGHVFGYHAWSQVWLGTWIDVDPTWGQFPADVSHIMMGDDSDSRWIALLGRLKVLSHKVMQSLR